MIPCSVPSNQPSVYIRSGTHVWSAPGRGWWAARVECVNCHMLIHCYAKDKYLHVAASWNTNKIEESP